MQWNVRNIRINLKVNQRSQLTKIPTKGKVGTNGVRNKSAFSFGRNSSLEGHNDIRYPVNNVHAQNSTVIIRTASPVVSVDEQFRSNNPDKNDNK